MVFFLAEVDSRDLIGSLKILERVENLCHPQLVQGHVLDKATKAQLHSHAHNVVSSEDLTHDVMFDLFTNLFFFFVVDAVATFLYILNNSFEDLLFDINRG